MYKNIVIATDGSDLAKKAIEQGLSLAKPLAAKTTIVYVTAPWSEVVPFGTASVFPIEEYEKLTAENAAKVFDGIVSKAKKAGVKCQTLHVKDQHPAEGIVKTAKDLRADLIVMASHGRRGISRLILGGEAYRVLTHSEIPVLICR